MSWRSVWQDNVSSVHLSFACYGFAVASAVFALLAHQLQLILTGRTAYDARRGEVSGESGGMADRVEGFLSQTAPLSATLASALAIPERGEQNNILASAAAARADSTSETWRRRWAQRAGFP